MPKQILLADDSETIAKIVQITFAHEDYAVTTVKSGDEALQRAQRDKPDIVLLDAGLPGKSGYDICAALREAGVRDVPVVLLTGNFSPYDEARGQRSGVDANVVKPFETQVMIDRVNQLLSTSRAGMQGGVTQPGLGQQPPPARTPTPAATPLVTQRPAISKTPSAEDWNDATTVEPSARTEPAPPVRERVPTIPPTTPPPAAQAQRPTVPPAMAGRTSPVRTTIVGFPTVNPDGTPMLPTAPAQPTQAPRRSTGQIPVTAPPVAARPTTPTPTPPTAGAGDKTVVGMEAPVIPAAGRTAPPVTPPVSAKAPATAPPTAAATPSAPISQTAKTPSAPVAVSAPSAPTIVPPTPASLPAVPPTGQRRPATPASTPAVASSAAPSAPQAVQPTAAARTVPAAVPPMPRAPLIPNAPPPRAGKPMHPLVAAAVERISARGPEYAALAQLSREVIEQIAWEVVPELAEAILKVELERLIKERKLA